MAIESYDLVTVSGDFITVDLLVWRRYRIRTKGIVEQTFADNPHLAAIHANGPFLPVGTQVRIPIDSQVMNNQPTQKQAITLYGRT